MICILGLPASGKTTFAEKLILEHPDYKLIHTDNYNNRLDYLLQDIALNNILGSKLMIEGVLCYELLTTKNIDSIIKTVYYLPKTLEEIKIIYYKERPRRSINKVTDMINYKNKLFNKIDQNRFNFITIK